MADPSGLPPGFVIDDTPPPMQMVSSGARTLPAGFALDTPDLVSGITNRAAQGITFGFGDPLAAVGRAAVQKYGFGEDKPFGDLYQRNLSQQRGEAQNFATENPVANAAAAGIGALASAKPAIAPAPVAGLFRQMGQGATLGATAGVGNALAESPNTDPLAVLRDAGAGALGGATVGAGMAPLGAVAGPPVSALARAILPGAVDRQAAQMIGGRIGQDAAAGGPGAAGIQSDLASALSGKPFSILDVSGENARALGGRLARAQGEPRQLATQFMDDRDAQAGTRLLDDVRNLISNGGSAFSTAQQLISDRANAARPLYQQAMAVGKINDPAIDNLIQNSSILRNTINAAKANYPQFAGLDRNDMVLLDQAYKDIGGRAAAARQSGDGALAMNLDTLRGDFKNALVRVNPAYGQALAAFSGPSDSMRAVELGQGIFSRSPDETRHLIGQLAPADQDFFRLGAADSIRNNITRTGSGGNEARAIVGNDLRQQQLRPLFGSQQDFDQFINAAKAEDRMFQTRYDVLGNSRTAARMAEDSGGHGGGGALANLIAGTAALPHEPVAGAGLIMRGLSAINRFPEGNNPQVNAAASRMLFNSDPAANQQTLAAILAGRAPVRLGMTVPAAGYAGSLYPQLEFAPGEKPKAGQPGAQ